jgi:hypothetical protein
MTAPRSDGAALAAAARSASPHAVHRTRSRERRIVAALCALWLAHLLVYAWVVPPWQHYDEPTHFEYAALIRELGRVPTFDERLPALRRAIGASMIETGFFQRRDIPLRAINLDAPDLSLGVNERGAPPAYYTLVALATLPLRAWPITAQLYAGRLVSVALALGTFAAAYALLRQATGDWRLRCAVLAGLALQPALADNMSALSGDSLAALAATLLLLAAVWFVRQPSPMRLLALAAVALATTQVKRTLLLLTLLLPLALFLSLPAIWRRRTVLAAVAVTASALMALLLAPWPLASWSVEGVGGYISTDPLHRAAPLASAAPLAGSGAFALGAASGAARELRQTLPRIPLEGVLSQTVTLAAWMRAEQPGVMAFTPALQLDGQVISRSVMLDTRWRLERFSATVPTQTRYLAVFLQAPPQGAAVLYDSLSLVRGDDAPPPPHDEPDSSFEPGLIAPGPARNLLRNSGAERAVPPVPAGLRVLTGGLLNEGFADALASATNPRWIAAVYPRQMLLLFVGSWGIFGWGEVLVPLAWLGPLGLLVFASLVGSLLRARRYRRLDRRQQTAGGQASIAAVARSQRSRAERAVGGLRSRSRVWLLCWGAVLLGWGAAMLRVHSQPFPGVMFWSFGRYTFVAAVPGMLVLIAGLYWLFPRRLRGQGLLGVLIFLLIYALAALFGTVLPAYATMPRT